MNKLSFFRLPLVFISVNALITIGWFVWNLNLGDFYHEIIPYLITANLLTVLSPLCLFFLIVVFQCNKYHLHTLDRKNLLVILLIAIIFSICSISWLYLRPHLLQPIYHYILEYYQLVSAINIIVTLLLHVIILLLLFKIMVGDVSQNKPYLFDTVSGKKIYASIFSLMLLTLSAIWILFSIKEDLIYFYSVYVMHSPASNVIIYFILPIIFLISVFNYWFVYASTVNCFKSVPTSLQFAPLIKSIGLTLLFMVIGSIVLAIILMLLIFGLLTRYSYHNSIDASVIIIFIIILSLSYLMFHIATRTAVKCIFKPKEVIHSQEEV